MFNAWGERRNGEETKTAAESGRPALGSEFSRDCGRQGPLGGGVESEAEGTGPAGNEMRNCGGAGGNFEGFPPARLRFSIRSDVLVYQGQSGPPRH